MSSTAVFHSYLLAPSRRGRSSLSGGAWHDWLYVSLFAHFSTFSNVMAARVNKSLDLQKYATIMAGSVKDMTTCVLAH